MVFGPWDPTVVMGVRLQKDGRRHDHTWYEREGELR